MLTATQFKIALNIAELDRASNVSDMKINKFAKMKAPIHVVATLSELAFNTRMMEMVTAHASTMKNLWFVHRTANSRLNDLKRHKGMSLERRYEKPAPSFEKL